MSTPANSNGDDSLHGRTKVQGSWSSEKAVETHSSSESTEYTSSNTTEQWNLLFWKMNRRVTGKSVQATRAQESYSRRFKVQVAFAVLIAITVTSSIIIGLHGEKQGGESPASTEKMIETLVSGNWVWVKGKAEPIELHFLLNGNVTKSSGNASIRTGRWSAEGNTIFIQGLSDGNAIQTFEYNGVWIAPRGATGMHFLPQRE